MPSILDHKPLLPVLVVAALVLAVAIWPAGAGTEAAATPAARTTSYKLAIPAAAFTPSFSDIGYVNSGVELSSLTGFAGYVAHLQFPYPVVTVKGITLHAYDNGSQDISLHLGRSRPATGAGGIIAIVGSDGQSTTDPRAFTTTAVSAKIINSEVHGLYLALFLPAGLDYKFYGVTIRYEA